MERKDKGYASIDDIYANPFMKMLIQVAADIVLTKKSINSTFTEGEKSILELYQSVRNIISCVNDIRMAVVFSKRFDKQYLSENEVNEEQYMTYHYDTIIHKLSTIKDLEFKIVAQIYNLTTNKLGNCSWNTIDKNRERINNEKLFSFFENELYKEFIFYFDKKRNKSTHEGEISISEFNDVSGELWLRDISKNSLYNNIPGSSYANSYYVSQLINKDRKKMTRKMEQIYQSCLNLIYIFFNSLFEDLSNVFTLDVKKNYSKTIASVFKNL